MGFSIVLFLITLFSGVIAGYKLTDFLQDNTNCIIVAVLGGLLVASGLAVHIFDGSFLGQLLTLLGLGVITYEFVGLTIIVHKKKEEPEEEDTSESLEERIQKLKEKNK